MRLRVRSPQGRCRTRRRLRLKLRGLLLQEGERKEKWRLEPKGEMETPEVIVLVNEAEGVVVNPLTEGHHERAQAKSSGRWKSKRHVKRVRRLKVLKRTVIRVESEETQDYVRESLNLSQDEAEETSFVPSAISIPQRPMFLCDDRCSDKALSFWQFASVVIEEGEEPYTANLCQQCYNESLMAKGVVFLKNWQWKAVVEKKGLWRMLVKDQ